MLRRTRTRKQSKRINESGLLRASRVNGTPLALEEGHGTDKEDPMQRQVEKRVRTAKDYFELPEEFRERFELVNGRMVRRRGC